MATPHHLVKDICEILGIKKKEAALTWLNAAYHEIVEECLPYLQRYWNSKGFMTAVGVADLSLSDNEEDIAIPRRFHQELAWGACVWAAIYDRKHAGLEQVTLFNSKWGEAKQKMKLALINGKQGKITMTQPRICPKSGMFIDEPIDGAPYWMASNYTAFDTCDEEWESSDFDEQQFSLGNCFATSEDAQRYANYLKAMAKLRRLSGYCYSGSLDFRADEPYRRIFMQISQAAEKQLTPEEQNALLWPDEEK